MFSSFLLGLVGMLFSVVLIVLGNYQPKKGKGDEKLQPKTKSKKSVFRYGHVISKWC